MWKSLLAIGLVGGWSAAYGLQADETEEKNQSDSPTRVIVIGERVEAQEVPSKDSSKDPSEESLWLGIALKSIEGDLAIFLGDDHGVLVDQIVPESPAEKAGLLRGDVLLSVDGRRLRGPDDLLEVMQSANKDQAMKLIVLRKSERLEVSITPAVRLKGAVSAFSINELSEGLKELGPFEFELDVQPGEESKMFLFRLPDPSGIVIPGIANIPKGIQLKGDLKVQITRQEDGKPVEVTISKKSDQPAEITVKRGEEAQKLTEEQLDQLPEDLRAWVKSALSEQGQEQAFWFKKGGDVEFDQSIEGLSAEEIAKLLNREGLERSVKELRLRLADGGSKWSENAQKRVYESLKAYLDQAKVAAEQAKELAQQNAQQAKQSAEQWSKLAEEQLRAGEAAVKAEVEKAVKEAEKLSAGDQIEELKRMVEQLRREVETLRADRRSDGDSN
jgi:hypothetical protein